MTRPRTHGVAIRMFLADGTPQGLRIVERMGWTGVCLAFARADYPEVRVREELIRTGVYVLIGPDDDTGRDSRIYVGEGDSVRVRLDSHHRSKDFWSDGFVLTTTDNSLNKAQVRYLESRLLALASEANMTTIDNGTAPEITWLSEPDKAVMESYLDYALAMLPLLGVSFFDPVDEPRPPDFIPRSVHDPHTETFDVATEVETRPLLKLDVEGAHAEARDESRGFVVYEGASARLEEKVMNRSYQLLRQKLIGDGTLVPDDSNSHYILKKNFIFDSPSAAASVLAGGSKNGRTVWKTENGETLKGLQESSVASVQGLPDGSEIDD